jgi:hypothetical protein
MLVRRVWALAVCVSTASCYSYATVPASELTPSMAVRMELSGVAVDRIRSGPDSARRLLDGFKVSGTISRMAADSIVVAVEESYMEKNVRLRTQLHDLPLLKSDVRHVESRRLDRKRTTWVAVGLGVAAAASTAVVLNFGGRSSGSIPKPVDPVDSRSSGALRWGIP